MRSIKPSNKKYFKIFWLAVCILVAYKVLFNFGSLMDALRSVLDALQPFIIGFVMAYFINIPCSKLESQLKKIEKLKPFPKAIRPISVVVCVIGVAIFCVFGLGNFIPMVYTSLNELFKLMPEFYTKTAEFIVEIPIWEALGLQESITDIFVNQQFDILGDVMAIPLESTMQFVTGFFSGIVTFILAIVSSIYFLLEYNSIRAYLKRVIGIIPSKEKRQSTLKYIRLVDKSFSQFLSCQILDSCIIGTVTTIQFLLMGSPYALVLGIMLGMVNIIPYFGAIIGSCVAVLILMFTQGFEIAVIAAIALTITQQIDGNFINPKIMGTSFKISPVLVIIAITVGGTIGAAFGGGIGRVAGMIFAIPVVNVLKIVLEEYLHIRETAAIFLSPKPLAPTD